MKATILMYPLSDDLRVGHPNVVLPQSKRDVLLRKVLLAQSFKRLSVSIDRREYHTPPEGLSPSRKSNSTDVMDRA
jgi:hypothetical protein